MADSTPKATPVAKATGSTPGLIRTFLLDHERLVIVLILASLCWWGYGKYADIRAAHDNATLQAQVLVTKQAEAATQAQAAQAAVDATALQALQAKLEAQQQALVQANATLAAALATRQKTDATLPPTALAQRWNTLVPAADPAPTPTGIAVSEAGAVATVQSLEQVPELTTSLANETTIEKNDQLIIGQQTKNIFDLNTEVTGLKTLGVDQAKQCTDEKNVMKSEFRKSKRHWFVAGVVVGFVGRQLIKMETGW